MVGWMTCDFTSFATVFQPYQDNGWVNAVCSGPPFTLKRSPSQAGLEPGTDKSIGQRLAP